MGRAGGRPGVVPQQVHRGGIEDPLHPRHQDRERAHDLDWRPFEYFTQEIARPSDGQPRALNTITLEPIEGGTRVCPRYRVLVKTRLIAVPVFNRM